MIIAKILTLVATSTMLISSTNEEIVKEVLDRTNNIIENKNTIIYEQSKKQFPDIFAKLESAKKEIAQKSKDSRDILYLLISKSVPNDVLEEFITQASILNYHYGTKVMLVYQGITDKENQKKLKRLSDILSEYDSASLFSENFNVRIDPFIFKKLNIKKVPAIVLATHEGKAYPSFAKTQYIARGYISPIDFIKLVSEKDNKYVEYYNALDKVAQ